MNRAAMDDLGRLVLRVALGALIVLHGISKLRNGLGPIEEMVTAHGMPPFVAYGVLVGEVVAPLMLLLGFYARIGGLLIAINMLFAIGLQFWFWLTPIVYPLGILPPFLQPWLALNPMTGLMQAYQGVFVQGLWPNWSTLWPALLAGVVCSLLAVLLLHQREAEMLDEL